MNTTFTPEQISRYIDFRIDNIERKAFAFQQVAIRIFDEEGKHTIDLETDSMEEIEDSTDSLTVTVNYNKKYAYNKVFEFRNIQDETLVKMIVDAFIEAGLPQSDKEVFEIMTKLEYMYNQPDTAVVLMNDGVVEQIVTSTGLQVLILDNDLEGLTPVELEENSVSLNGQDYYVPNVHKVIDPTFTVDIHNKANKL